MKPFIIIMALLVGTTAFAKSLDCSSKNYQVVITQDEAGDYIANYAINGIPNEGADVLVEQALISSQVSAASLSVDGQKSKIKVAAMRMAGINKQQGTIAFGSDVQAAKCTFKKD